MNFQLEHLTETDMSNSQTLSMAREAAEQFIDCRPLADIPEACLDALRSVLAAELQERSRKAGYQGLWDDVHARLTGERDD